MCGLHFFCYLVIDLILFSIVPQAESEKLSSGKITSGICYLCNCLYQ